MHFRSSAVAALSILLGAHTLLRHPPRIMKRVLPYCAGFYSLTSVSFFPASDPSVRWTHCHRNQRSRFLRSIHLSGQIVIETIRPKCSSFFESLRLQSRVKLRSDTAARLTKSLGQMSSMAYEGLFLNKKLLLSTFVELYDNGAWGYRFLLLGALSV